MFYMCGCLRNKAVFNAFNNEKLSKSTLKTQVGPKKAREMWFLARFYSASEAEKMGLVNAVVPVNSYAQLQFTHDKAQ